MLLTFSSILRQNRRKDLPFAVHGVAVAQAAGVFRHGQCPGDVPRVVIGRFAGQEYSFAVSWEYMALFCAL